MTLMILTLTLTIVVIAWVLLIRKARRHLRSEERDRLRRQFQDELKFQGPQRGPFFLEK